MKASAIATPLTIRDLAPEDLPAVVEIDALHTGVRKRHYWRQVFDLRVAPSSGHGKVRLAAQAGDELVGYLLGEVRAFEFGSEACGWVFAVGVDPAYSRRGIASALLGEACARFRDWGLDTVRTMVRRNDVPVLAFFRSNGFAGGSFYQLELELKGGSS